MKKVFFVLAASAALSFTACNSGEKKTETMDTEQTDNMVQEAMDSVNSTMNQTTVDTASKAMEQMADTVKK